MSANSEESIGQIALFIQESSVRPPPPPTQAPSSSVPGTSAQASWRMNVAMQHLPPPPPPPPLPVPSTSTSQPHNTVYCGQSPQPSNSFAIFHPPTSVPMFDATRPPPQINTQVQLNNNTLKRTISTSCTGGSCKLRKTEEAKPDGAMCDQCVQREISIKTYKTKLDKISSEVECQTFLFEKKLNAYRRQKEFLHSLVDSDIFRKVEEFVENVPQNNFHRALNNLNDSFLTGLTSSLDDQILLKFMDFLSKSSTFEASQSTAQDSFHQTLSAISRSPVSRSSIDQLQTLQDMLHSEVRSSSFERTEYYDLTIDSDHRPGTSGVSSCRQYSNGQSMELCAPPAQAPVPLAPPPPPPDVAYPHCLPPRSYYPPESRPSTNRAPVSSRPTHAEPYLPHYTPEPRASTNWAPTAPRPAYAEPYRPPYRLEPRASTGLAPVTSHPAYAETYRPPYRPEPRVSTSQAPVASLPAYAEPYRPPYQPPYRPKPRTSTSQAPVSLRPPHAEPYLPPYYYYQ